jgi:outer membrane protein OmpA-like peptidoglycan-associated protein
VAAIDLVENRRVRFEFDEAGLSPNARRLIVALLAGMKEAGYSGRIRLEGHLGQFCAITVGDGPVLAPDSMPISRCVRWPGSEPYSLALGQRLTSSLRSLLLTQGIFDPSRMQAVSFGLERPLVAYPTRGTAKEWNAAARTNNRVEVKLY